MRVGPVREQRRAEELIAPHPSIDGLSRTERLNSSRISVFSPGGLFAFSSPNLFPVNRRYRRYGDRPLRTFSSSRQPLRLRHRGEELFDKGAPQGQT